MSQKVLNLFIVFIIQRQLSLSYAQNLRCQKVDFNRPSSIVNEFSECLGESLNMLKINAYSATTIVPFRPTSAFHLSATDVGLSCLQSTSHFTLDENSEIRTAIFLTWSVFGAWVRVQIVSEDDENGEQVLVVANLEQSDGWVAFSEKVNRSIHNAQIEIRTNMNINSILAIEYVYALNSDLPDDNCTDIDTDPPEIVEPTDNPETEQPTDDPVTEVPTDNPETEVPTDDPETEVPTDDPETEEPTDNPGTEEPTDNPETEEPTDNPETEEPTDNPETEQPTDIPETEEPTQNPETEEPTDNPETEEPTDNPETEQPTDIPETEEPTDNPETEEPTDNPETEEPTDNPETEQPTDIPETEEPTDYPETEEPTDDPETEEPTEDPETEEPTDLPETEPTEPENETTTDLNTENTESPITDQPTTIETPTTTLPINSSQSAVYVWMSLSVLFFITTIGSLAASYYFVWLYRQKVLLLRPVIPTNIETTTSLPRLIVLKENGANGDHVIVGTNKS